VRKGGGFGTGYCSAVYNNCLYAGTNQGLFRLNLNNESKIHTEQNDFALIAKTEGQVWGLYKLNGSLLCGHNSGLYVIKNGEANRIFDLCGVWDIKPIPNQPDLFIVGTYYGFFLMQDKKNGFSIVGKITGLDESARRFFFDQKGYLWMSHVYKGIYQLKLSSDFLSVSKVRIFDSSTDFLVDYNNEAVLIRNKVLATTEKGIYEFNYAENKFVYNPKWDDILNGNAQQLTRMIEGGEKKIWAFKKGSIQLITYLNDKVYELNTRPFLLINGTLSRSYENVLMLDQNRYLMGTEDGFVLYQDLENQQYNESIPLTVAWVNCILNNNRLEMAERIPIRNATTNELGEIPFRNRHLSVKLSMPFYTSQELVKFRYRVNRGEWGSWLNGNTMDLNALEYGDFRIDIQCSIDEKDITGTSQLSFTILPPIQRTWYAYLTFLLLIGGLISWGYYMIKKRIAHEKRKEYLAQRKKMILQGIKLKNKTRDAESELNILRNEKLQTDIIHKSKELANITMSIIQKNIILGEIKENLQELIDENSTLKNSSKVNQLVRKAEGRMEGF